MDILWLILSLLTVATSLGWLARVVHDDGLGDREPPRSHPSDAPGTHVFSR